MGFWQFATGGGSGGGSGDVVGPASATDNAIARFDTGTGKLLQNSDVTVSDLAAGAVTISAGKGTAITLKNTDPDATTGASVAGDALSITAGNAVASTDTAGAAAGGDVILTAGAAARLTSGDAQGGNIQLKIGAGIGAYPKGFISANGGNGGIRLLGDTASGQPLSWFTVALWRGSLSNYGIFLSSDSALYWTSGSTESETADTGLARSAAGVVKVTDGSTGLGGLVVRRTDSSPGIYFGGTTASDFAITPINTYPGLSLTNGTIAAWKELVVSAVHFGSATQKIGSSGTQNRSYADGGLSSINEANSALSPLLGGIDVTASTAGAGSPRVLEWYESGGTAWTNEGAGAKAYITLPSAVSDMHVTFIVQDADGLRITANTGDTIRVIDKVTAAAGYIESTTIGSVVTLIAINATEWIATSIHGVWTDGTFTYDDTSLTTP